MNKFQIAYRLDVIGKPDKVGKWRNEFVNSDDDLDIDDIIDLVAVHGSVTSYVLKDEKLIIGRSHDTNIKGAWMIMLDFDNTSTLEELQQHPWYQYSAFGYTTPSFGDIQKDDNKFQSLSELHKAVVAPKLGKPKDNCRLVFLFDRFIDCSELEIVVSGLLSLFPMADPQCTGLARMIYGCKDAQVIRNNAIVSIEQIEYLKELGEVHKATKKVITKERTQAVYSDIEGDINITLADGHIYSISEIFSTFPKGFKTACYSPFRNEDNPSAFVHVFEDNGNVFVHDSGSGTQKIWLAKDFVKPTLTLAKKNKVRLLEPEPFEKITVEQGYKDTGIGAINYFNEQYVPADLYYDLNESGLIFVKSAKGTGKTELLKTLVERVRGEKGSCLLIGHRVALLNNQSIRLGLDNYQNEDPTKFFAISVDSLQKISEENIGIPYDTVIIDEVEQVLNHFKSSTLRKKRKMVFKQFIDKLRAAKRIILLDADVSPEITIELIRLIRGKELWASDDTQGFINEYQPGIGRSYNMYQTKEHMIFDLCNLLASDPLANAFVITNSKTLTKEIEQLISGLNLPPVVLKVNLLGETDHVDTSKTLLCIHSDNSMADEQQAFITNPRDEGNRYRVVVSSPTISTGVSIDGDHFGHVFGFFNDSPFTFYDCDQAISRVRNTKAVINVWMPEIDADSKLLVESKLIQYGTELGLDSNTIQNLINNFSGYDSEEVIDRQIHNTAELYAEIELTTRRLTMGTEQLSPDELIWVRFLATLDVITVNRMRGRKLKFIQYVESNGYSCIDVELDEDDNNIGKGFMKANRINAKEEEINNIFNAPLIEFDEYMTLRKLKHIASKTSNEDYYKRTKFEIVEWLESIDVDITDIDNYKFFIKEDIRAKYWNLKNALLTESEIKKLDVNEREHGKKAIGDMRNRIQIRELYDGLVADVLGYAGYSFNEFYNDVMSGSISIISNDQLDALGQAILGGSSSDINGINKLFECELRSSGIRTPKRVWDAIFGYVGLELKGKKVSVKGVKEWQYSVNVCDRNGWVHTKVARDDSQSKGIIAKKEFNLTDFMSGRKW